MWTVEPGGPRLRVMRYLLLLLTLLIFTGCEPPQSFEDEPDMIRQTRNPPVAPYGRQGIPQVVATIPREGLWSGYNQLGYLAKYGPDQRQTQTILKLDEWGPPEVWTVSLYVKGDFTLFDGFNIRARINFGAGGSTQVYECDWLNGTQISLPMNAINVEAIFDDVDVQTEGKGLSVGVQLARGARGGTTPPVLTLAEQVTIVGGGSSAIIRLPNFAKNVYAIPAEGFDTTSIAAFYSGVTALQLYSGNNPGFSVASITGTQMAQGMKLPVAGSARFVVFYNGNGALVPLDVSIVTELDG